MLEFVFPLKFSIVISIFFPDVVINKTYLNKLVF